MINADAFLGKMVFAKLKDGVEVCGFLRKPDFLERLMCLWSVDYIISVYKEGASEFGFKNKDVDFIFELAQKPVPEPLIEESEPSADKIIDVEVKPDAEGE